MHISKQTFQKRPEKLYHPDSPGMRVIVVRGFWGRLFKPKKFATLNEAIQDNMRNSISQ